MAEVAVAVVPPVREALEQRLSAAETPRPAAAVREVEVLSPETRLIETVVGRVVERLAAIEHELWSHWQRYMHDKATRRADGALLIPADLVARWEKQIATDYADLSPKEQGSDKEQVERYLPIIEATFGSE